MARFKFYLIGSSDAPVLDVEAADLRELNQQMSSCRFIEGHMAEGDVDGVLAGMLIATSRVQLVMEA
jgi:hypothetical protein